VCEGHNGEFMRFWRDALNPVHGVDVVNTHVYDEVD
jgi:hypothetical protein